MNFEDLFGSLFSGDTGSDGSGSAAAWQYGIGAATAQIPYLGIYLTGRGEEFYDLTHQWDGRSVRWERKSASDPFERVPGYFDAEPDLPPGTVDLTQEVRYGKPASPLRRYGGPQTMLGSGTDDRQDLSSRYLLADNSANWDAPGQIRIDSSGRPDLPWLRPENASDGRSELTPLMPIKKRADPVDEVTVPGVRPERPEKAAEPFSGSSPSRGMPSGTPGLPQPSQRWEPFEQIWKRRREASTVAPPGWLIQPGVAAPFVQNRQYDSSESWHEGHSSPQEGRDFLSRGGAGLVGGVLAIGGGIALISNPVGWVAMMGGALMLAGGVASSSASSVELWASYRGSTTSAQDAAMNQAVAATLGYTAGGLGSVAGATIGTVVADDPRQGFQTGAELGGLPEDVMALPGAVRALPRAWKAAVPWGQALLMAPGMMFLSAGGAGGSSVRSMARVLAAQRRAASGIRGVQIIGTTPVLHLDKDWALYQIAATGGARETIFVVTYANGEQQVVAADHFLRQANAILEAKLGDMGMMYNLEHEARIVLQAQTYVAISNHTGAQVRYLISTELGASRLSQRFALEFPDQIKSEQLIVSWKPWQKRRR